MRLDQALAKDEGRGRRAALRLIADARVTVDGAVARSGDLEVNRFTRIEVGGRLIAEPEPALHLMLHKPAGHVSATVDPDHPTVLDLIDHPLKHRLHLAGRLDRSSSGLVLLTNDGRWSKQLTAASGRVPKVYRVETPEPIAAEAVAAFARGFHFHTEDIVTQPAKLEILGPCVARVTLCEGRYHQIKRMFHRVQNRVSRLHRERIGALDLPADLPPGAWRWLTPDEIAAALQTG